MDQNQVQRKILEIRILEQQAKQFEEQIIMAEQQIAEITFIQNSLDEIEKIKSQNILAPLSREVFIEARAESVKTVLVSVGAGVVVRKTTAEAKQYVEMQKNKFLDAREHLSEEIMKIIEKMGQIENEIRQ